MEVIQKGFYDSGTGQHQSNTVYSVKGLCPTITTITGGGTIQIKILKRLDKVAKVTTISESKAKQSKAKQSKAKQSIAVLSEVWITAITLLKVQTGFMTGSIVALPYQRVKVETCNRKF